MRGFPNRCHALPPRKNSSIHRNDLPSIVQPELPGAKASVPSGTSKLPSEKTASLTTSPILIVTFVVGSTAAAVSGYLADLYGLQVVFYAMGFCFLISAGLIIGLVLQKNN